MAYRHGIYVSEQETSLVAPLNGTAGLQVVVGTAPVHLLANPESAINTPILVYSKAEAVAALGYSDEFESYTLCEAVAASFSVVNTAPMVLINVLDPAKHASELETRTLQINSGVAVLEEKGVLLGSLLVKSSEIELRAEEDYTAAYNADGTLSIAILEGGAADGATNLTISGSKVDPGKVTAADIVGGVDTATGAESGLEVVRQVYPKFGMTPGILTAPRFSADASVSAALQAKTKEINGVFKCVCIADVDSGADGARKYADVKEQKERQALTDPNAYGVWGYGKVGNVVYSGSALASALTSYTDAANDDIPANPSNKTISISAMCLADGTEVLLDQDQANVVNGYGVATWLNMNGFRLWGNRTCAYPGNTDPKDSFFACRRYMSWRANSFIQTYFQKVDSPLNKRLIEAIVDSENVRGNGYVAMGVAARDEITYNEEDNPVTDLMNGKITFHQYMTPYTPAEDIEDVIEFDPDALVSALS